MSMFMFVVVVNHYKQSLLQKNLFIHACLVQILVVVVHDGVGVFGVAIYHFIFLGLGYESNLEWLSLR